MLSSNHRFENHDVFDIPARLLLDDEIEYIFSIFPRPNIKQISVDAPVCKRLGAREDNVICIRYNNTDLYRRVVGPFSHV